MHPTLLYIPREIFDLPVFGFGLLLALWVLGSLGLLAWLVWRQGLGADTRAYASILVLVAAIIWLLLPAMCQSRGLPIRGYGAMIVAAFVAATGLAAWRARRVGLDPDLILSLAFWVLVPGVIGARLFYVIEYWPEQYWEDYRQGGAAALIAAVVNIAQGGLVVYGAFVGALLGLLAFVRYYRLRLLALCDLIAPSLLLGLALGRIGCLMNGCCYGGLCELPWAVTFPPDSPPHFHQVEYGQTFVHGLKIVANPQGQPVIREVEHDSPAEKQGLKPGQLITRINGIEVPTIKKATGALLGANKLSIAIEGSRYVGQWIIRSAPPGGPPVPGAADIDRIKRGEVFLHGLKIMGNPTGQPVIKEVRPDSPPERHGLKPGQRITRIDGREVKTIDDAAWALLNTNRISIATGGGPVRRWTLQAAPSGSRMVRPVHPTQVYSAINALLLCLLLLAYDPFHRRDGEVFALALSIYPITRFLLEIIRTDESAVFGTGLSISQNGSLILLACAAALWCYVLRRPHGSTGC